MIYAIVKDGEVVKYPYTLEELKKDNPNVSFPKSLTQDDLDAFNLLPYMETSPPMYDNKAYQIQRTLPEIKNGKVVVGWEVLPRRDAEIRIRQERDRRLAECDWTQMPDSPLSEEDKNVWAQYRQALRDIPNQLGFPLSYSFPEKP